jgi:hypothetical protein
MSDQTLILLAKDVRGKTMRILDGLTDEQSRFAAPGLCNSILWHAGHAIVVVEHVSVAPLAGGKLAYPRGYFETFSWKSDPRTVTTWPTIAEVRQQLVSQLSRLLALLESTDEQTLAMATDPARGRTIRWSVMHGLHDEANHQGEMWLLRKLLDNAGK